jgi:hypothetical protein
MARGERGGIAERAGEPGTRTGETCGAHEEADRGNIGGRGGIAERAGGPGNRTGDSCGAHEEADKGNVVAVETSSSVDRK